MARSMIACGSVSAARTWGDTGTRRPTTSSIRLCITPPGKRFTETRHGPGCVPGYTPPWSTQFQARKLFVGERPVLACAELSIAGVAEAGDYVTVSIEMTVNGGEKDGHVGMDR